MNFLNKAIFIKRVQTDPIVEKIPIVFYSARYKAAEAYRMTNAFNTYTF